MEYYQPSILKTAAPVILTVSSTVPATRRATQQLAISGSSTPPVQKTGAQLRLNDAVLIVVTTPPVIILTKGLQTLTTATDSNQLILLSRQEYPQGTEYDQNHGIFRITRLTRGNDTQPALDASFGEEVAGSLLYPPGPSGFIQPDASLVSQVVDEQQLTCLYAPEKSGGIQLARFPLNGTDDTYQVITDSSLPGKPVLLSDNGSALWMQEGNSRIRRYDLDEKWCAC